MLGQGAQLQGVDLAAHQRAQRGVDHPVAGQRQLAGKGFVHHLGLDCLDGVLEHDICDSGRGGEYGLLVGSEVGADEWRSIGRRSAGVEGGCGEDIEEAGEVCGVVTYELISREAREEMESLIWGERFKFTIVLSTS